ncbi:MAG: carbonic anhydrase [Bacteroidota bacterium]
MTKIANVSADKALELLIEGNKRFIENHSQHPHEDQEWRIKLKEGQHPFAVILTCADSRVAPEIVFDQGLGDLFVVRVAGNVAKEKVLGSIEYAVANLGVNLVMVLGHEKCGAVHAAIGSDVHPGHIGIILENIKPAVYMAQGQEGDLLTNAVKNNAKIVAGFVRESQPVMAPLVEEGGVKVVPAYYSIAQNQVELL